VPLAKTPPTERKIQYNHTPASKKERERPSKVNLKIGRHSHIKEQIITEKRTAPETRLSSRTSKKKKKDFVTLQKEGNKFANPAGGKKENKRKALLNPKMGARKEKSPPAKGSPEGTLRSMTEKAPRKITSMSEKRRGPLQRQRTIPQPPEVGRSLREKITGKKRLHPNHSGKKTGGGNSQPNFPKNTNKPPVSFRLTSKGPPPPLIKTTDFTQAF